MTSQISFYKLMRQDLRRRGWMLALMSVCALCVYPLVGMLRLENKMSMVHDEMYRFTWQDLLVWYRQMIGPDNVYSMIFIVCAAVLLAVTGFSYLHVKEKLDFYHSLPVRRETLFSSIYVSGIGMFLVPYLASYALLIIWGSIQHVRLEGAGTWILQTVGWNVLFFLLVYGVTALAMLLSGKLVTGISGAVVFLFYGGILEYSIKAMETFFYKSYLDAGTETFSLSPVLCYTQVCSRLDAKGHMTLSVTAAVCLAVVLVTALGIFLSRIRPTEAAEMAVAFPKMEGLLKILISVPMAFVISNLIASKSVRQDKWFLIGGLLSVVLVNLVLEFIYRMDFKKIFRQKLVLCISILLAAGVFLFFKYDLSGFEQYFPKKEEISRIGIRADACMNYIEGRQGSTPAGNLSAVEIQMNSELYNFLEEAVKSQKKWRKEEKSGDYNPSVTVLYHLDNGKRVYRSYAMPMEKQVRMVRLLLDDPLYYQQAFRVQELLSLNIDGITYSDLMNQYQAMILSGEQRESLIKTYEKELMAVDVFDLRGQTPVAVINVDCYKDDAQDGSRSYNSVALPVYARFTETIGLLTQAGYALRTEISAEDIEKIVVEEWGSEEDQMWKEADGARKTTITDRSLIEKIVPELYPQILSGFFNENGTMEDGINLNVIWKDKSQISFGLKKGSKIQL